MAIELDWGNAEETLLIWTCDTHWTSEEYYEAVVAGKNMIESQSHPVDVIVDMQFNRMRPMQLLQLAKYGYRHRSLNVGTVVLIYRSTFWLFLEDTLQSIFGHEFNLLFVRDANEAYDVLNNQRFPQMTQMAI